MWKNCQIWVIWPERGILDSRNKLKPKARLGLPKRHGGNSISFLVGVCGLDFWNVGLTNEVLPLNEESYELKFSNLGTWELTFGQKLRLQGLKFPNFSQKGVLWTELTFKLFCLKWEPCKTKGEAWKGDLQSRTSPYPFLGQCLPPPPPPPERHIPVHLELKCHPWALLWILEVIRSQ